MDDRTRTRYRRIDLPEDFPQPQEPGRFRVETTEHAYFIVFVTEAGDEYIASSLLPYATTTLDKVADGAGMMINAGIVDDRGRVLLAPAMPPFRARLRNVLVEPGDRVRDPFDGTWRRVEHIDGEQVFMADGGVMGLDEAERAEKLLPSEAEPEVTDAG